MTARAASGDEGVDRADVSSRAEEDPEAAERAPRYRGLRDARYTYAVAHEGRWLMFDRQEDPYEMKDLSKDPAHAERMRGYDEKLQAWVKQTGDTFVYPKLA